VLLRYIVAASTFILRFFLCVLHTFTMHIFKCARVCVCVCVRVYMYIYICIYRYIYNLFVSLAFITCSQDAVNLLHFHYKNYVNEMRDEL
jgi:hypothetical protein